MLTEHAPFLRKGVNTKLVVFQIPCEGCIDDIEHLTIGPKGSQELFIRRSEGYCGQMS
jgi:hypothetical protein